MTTLRSVMVALIGIVWASSALAGPDRVAILLGSEHVNADGFEETNPGIFLTWTEAVFNNRADVSIGGFRNSYGDGSLAVSLAVPIVRKKHWGIDAFSALAWYPGNGDRFEFSAGDVIPIIGLQTRVGPTFVQFIPGGDDSVDAILSFGLTFDLNN